MNGNFRIHSHACIRTSTPRQQTRDRTPPHGPGLARVQKDGIFGGRPVAFLHHRIEVGIPALTTLLGVAPGQMLGDDAPPRAELRDPASLHLLKHPKLKPQVLVLGPLALVQVRVEHVLPPHAALVWRAIRDQLRDGGPVFFRRLVALALAAARPCVWP
jgi:hypothetical protein